MLRPTLCRPPASAISPSSLRVLASAAYSNPKEDATSKDANPKEDATSKDANPKGLESLSFPMLNFGLGTIVACAGFATMLSELSADIKHNHSEFTTKIDHVKENFADAMISPEERNAATVGALLSLSPPRGAGGKAQERGRRAWRRCDPRSGGRATGW